METKKELGITKGDFRPSKLFRTDNGNGQMAIVDEKLCAVAFVPKLHENSEQWMDLIESIPELLDRYNEAIEVLEEANKDLIVLHGNIYQEIKKGNSQWEGVDEIIYKRIESNKQTISKSK